MPLALLVLCVVVANRELAALGGRIAELEGTMFDFYNKAAGVGPPIRRTLLLRISDFGAARSVPPVFSCDFVCFAASLFAF